MMAPKNSAGRWMHQQLVQLGYTCDGVLGNGHFVYRHPDQPDYHVSGTAYDAPPVRRAFRAEMRKRHPGHALFTPPSSSSSASHRPTTRQRDRREQARIKAALRAAERDAERRTATHAVGPCVPRPERTSCVECGRRWLSDLDPTGRLCPACDGEIVVGTLDQEAA